MSWGPPTAARLDSMQELCDDLAAEHAALDAVLDAATDWDAPTPAEGWSIRDTVSHLWFFDQRALLALTDPEAFAADAVVLLERGVEISVEPGRRIEADELRATWRRDRGALIDHARTVDPSMRVPWYGPAMGARSFITARLMETWAHGQDVVDVVGADRPVTDRLRHVAHIGVRARPFSYAVNERPMPAADVYVGLEAPGGGLWEWGDVATPDRVTGPALDFCLLVTQRRHLSDTSLEVSGPAAAEWMSIAQAFAGPPSGGRPPLT
jgi:uncharacterized protein (TIGR03084 family)